MDDQPDSHLRGTGVFGGRDCTQWKTGDAKDSRPRQVYRRHTTTQSRGEIVWFALTATLAWSSSVATLLPGVESVSNSVIALTWAVLLNDPAVVAVATMVSVALAPEARLPMFQIPETLLNVVLPLGVEETNVNPAGS